jgi:hypothetical protein
MMGLIWFWLVAVMIVAYVVLDGFDLGVGVLHLFLVHTEAERKATLASIGPVWDGNEVWLLAGGGTLYFAFPLLYAISGRPTGLGLRVQTCFTTHEPLTLRDPVAFFMQRPLSPTRSKYREGRLAHPADCGATRSR